MSVNKKLVLKCLLMQMGKHSNSEVFRILLPFSKLLLVECIDDFFDFALSIVFKLLESIPIPERIAILEHLFVPLSWSFPEPLRADKMRSFPEHLRTDKTILISMIPIIKDIVESNEKEHVQMISAFVSVLLRDTCQILEIHERVGLLVDILGVANISDESEFEKCTEVPTKLQAMFNLDMAEFLRKK